jgi:uncharacterized protein YecE (DUF72 family)
MAKIRIGTSGWHYPSWRGPFFPTELMVKHQLRYYSTQFDTSELNGVFYRTPMPKAVKGWREQTGEDFLFAWKASKFVTHWMRLAASSVTSLHLLEERISLLGPKIGPILFQLPPRFTANPDRLEQFIRLLSGKRRYSFEFRHPSWYIPRIMRLLSDANIALCLSDHHDAPAPWQRTADFVYVRGHGPGGRYKGHYRTATLNQWAETLANWRGRGFDSFVYFDNDQKSAAPRDALRLKQIVAMPFLKR